MNKKLTGSTGSREGEPIKHISLEDALKLKEQLGAKSIANQPKGPTPMPEYDPSQWSEVVEYYREPDEGVQLEPFNNPGCLGEAAYAFLYLAYVLAVKTHELMQKPIYEKPHVGTIKKRLKPASEKELRRNQILVGDIFVLFYSMLLLFASLDRFMDKLAYYQQFDPNKLQQLLAYGQDLLATIQNVESVNAAPAVLYYREIIGAALGVVGSTKVLKILNVLSDSPVKKPLSSIAGAKRTPLTTTRKSHSQSRKLPPSK